MDNELWSETEFHQARQARGVWCPASGNGLNLRELKTPCYLSRRSWTNWWNVGDKIRLRWCTVHSWRTSGCFEIDDLSKTGPSSNREKPHGQFNGKYGLSETTRTGVTSKAKPPAKTWSDPNLGITNENWCWSRRNELIVLLFMIRWIAPEMGFGGEFRISIGSDHPDGWTRMV